MTRKQHIEANLDRSLANQVKAPRLERRFNAAVWARIEAAEQRATQPVAARREPKPARWLFISNGIGVAVAVLLVVKFGMESFSGVSVNVPTPELSFVASEQMIKIAAQAISIAAVAFGFMFTPYWRRLRAELT
jgi:hypothetical protein